MKNFCLYHKNISTESVMCDCQQLQLMYEIHHVKNDNDYTLIKRIIKEEKKWWYGTGVNMSKNCISIDLRSAPVNNAELCYLFLFFFVFVLFFTCAWKNCWASNRDAGDLRRYRVHYDVTVIIIPKVRSNERYRHQIHYWPMDPRHRGPVTQKAFIKFFIGPVIINFCVT